MRRRPKIGTSTLTITGFASVIGLGTALLMLPYASTGRSLLFVDALFTATSATCVTGLIVVDTGKDLSLFGQLIVLSLIQIGGLGIMTISTIFLLLAGRRPSLSSRTIIQDTFTHARERSATSLLAEVVRLTFIIEGMGLLLFMFRFLPEYGLARSLYLSVFHTISAFCNAGFSLFSDSFMGYRSDWLVNFTLCSLILAGGMGFPVLSELIRILPFRHRTWSRLSLHSKLVLFSTAGLLALGTLFILFFEWSHTLNDLTYPGRFMAALFQSVTTRTAGFNTLPIARMADESLFLILLLMFIGASPGSCGGGIKTTTFATLMIIGPSRLRGYDNPQVFNRAISSASAGRAISVVMTSILVVVVGTLGILMIEGEGGSFMAFFFEVFSAFGTVGLSMGVTAGLSSAGKLVVTVIMFVGRLGPLVVALAVTQRVAMRYHYPEENIMIG